MVPVIAIVGRPNVGKSTLFNRLTRTRDAIVAEYAGLTRDRQYGRGVLGDFDYIVVDTGGLTGDEDGIDGPMAEQARHAIGEADLCLMLVDARAGRTPGDEAIAETLRRGKTPTIVVANKVDGSNPDSVSGEFAQLGLGAPAPISASHGNGVAQLVNEVIGGHDAILLASAEPEAEPADAGIKIAIVGRPNVGKSTLVNRILGEERVVVFDEAGTTRDSIFVPFERDGRFYTLIDTAGVRRRGRVNETVEKFSVIKTLDAINTANVVVLPIDARQGLVEQDLHLLGHVVDSGRALVIAVNKWDGTEADQKDIVRREIERRLRFVDYAQVHYISALHGSGVGNLFESIHTAYEAATRELKTNKLNDILAAAVQEHQPPMVRGHRIKLRYVHLGGRNPPTLVIHGNQTESVPDSYRRFLEHRFRDALGLAGTPIRLELRTSDNPYKGRKNELTERQRARKRRLMAHTKKKGKKKK
ncbi:MAG: ribosome biogenesis GTPase Der [Gammaproteobacteria bacterium]|nr:ribosome biogenesis GTPase Der [Gammaproteobacteria bacterium]